MRMNKVALYSTLLVTGMVLSQLFPAIFGEGYATLYIVFHFISMVFLGFIMIRVGIEFEIHKDRLASYGWDYIVAMTAAAFPWIFCVMYFIAILDPGGSFFSLESWKNALLGARFAAPTSAGILFSMLAAAGLAGTWVYRKARILAIFDDVDTVLFIIPLKMFIVGFKLQLMSLLILSGSLLYAAWRLFHAIRIPSSWPWVLFYSLIITLATEAALKVSLWMDEYVPLHFEVLLPAFVLGCMIIHHQKGEHNEAAEERAGTLVSGAFMVLVGLSLPLLFGSAIEGDDISWPWVSIHVALVTAISNLGKIFPVFCYRKEAGLRERIALCISLFPRGEVGAGVLMVAQAYGLSRMQYTVAALSLAVNLVLTGVFITVVRRLITGRLIQDPAIIMGSSDTASPKKPACS